MKIILTVVVAAFLSSLVTAGPTRAFSSKSFNALSADELSALADEIHEWRGTQAGRQAMEHGLMPSSAAQALASIGDVHPNDTRHQAQSKSITKFHPAMSKSAKQNAAAASTNTSSESIGDDPNMRELLERFHNGKRRVAELAKIQPLATFSMQTPFALMTTEEWKAYVDRGRLSVSALMSKHNTTITTNATVSSTRHLRQMANPASKDWAAEGKVAEVKDQGSCNVCSVFSVVAAIESGYAIATGNAVPSLSDQDVISCGPMQGSCNVGGDTQDTLDWMVNYNGGSLCTRDSFPYGGKDGSTVSCSRYDDPNKACYKPDLGVVGYNEDVYDDHQVLESVVASQPVAVVINGSPSWFIHYKGGVMMGNEKECPSDYTSINHAVTIVGYGTSSTGVKYWKAKNSWGTSWGDSGFFYMERGYQGAVYGACGIEKLGVYPVFRSKQPKAENQRCAPKRVGHQTTGTTLKVEYPKTNSACCDLCRSHPDCVAVNFEDSRSRCILMKTMTGDQLISGMSTIILRSKSESDSMCLPVENNIDYGGNDILRLMTSSPGDCCDACMRNPSCNAYTWSQWNRGSCFLKTNRGSSINSHPVNSDGSSYYVSGEVYKCQGATRNQDIQGQDLSSAPAANAYSCCGICRTTSGCAAFTWTNYNGGTCWLKTGNAKMGPNSGATSASIF